MDQTVKSFIERANIARYIGRSKPKSILSSARCSRHSWAKKSCEIGSGDWPFDDRASDPSDGSS
jgi:hypothetical protein